MKKILSIIVLIICLGVSGQLNAQCTDRPIINDFTPKTGFIGSTVTITGANFSATPSENQVFFGATQATIESSTFGTLVVRVPEGSTTALISVKNQCDLTAYSKTHFNGIFCPTPLTSTSYQNTAQELGGIFGAYNMLSQDMDNDGKPEVISARNGGGITIAINNSTPGTINFTRYNQGSTGGAAQSIAVADFDGDGLKDIVTNSAIMRNTSTGTGNIGLTYVTNSRAVSNYQVGAGDFNNDGKIDIIGENGNSVWVAFNTSTGPGNFNFTNRIFVANVGTRCTGIQIADVDGDGKVDFLASQGGGNRAVSLRNTTSNGSLTPSFETPEYWSSDANPADGTGTFPYRAMIADFDKDGRIDFTSCNYLGTTNTAIWRNTSTVGDISFATAVNIPSPTRNYRIGVGDVDGDGYPDIVTKSLGANVFSVYRNTTTAAGTPTFAPRFDYTSSNRAEVSGIVIGDLDGDFVPDIATSGISSNTIRFHRNTGAQNDVTPPTTVCRNITVALDPNGSVTITPEMIDNGSGDACGIESLTLSETTFTCADIGENTVTLTATDGAGNTSSCTATVNVQPAAIIVSGQSTVCQGETVEMNANQGDSYQWKKDGLDIPGATNQNYTASETGNYTVIVTNAGGCSGESLVTPVVVNENPTVDISPSGNAFLCPPNNSTTLTASQSSIYQWMKDGVDIPNATQQTYEATSVGEYSVRVIDLFGCSAISDVVNITANPAEIEVTGDGNYGNVFPNQDYTRTITISNTGTGTLDLTNLNISGADAASFSLSGFSTPGSISAGNSVTVDVTFNAPNITTYSAQLSFNSNDCDEGVINIPLNAEITCVAAGFGAFPSDINVNNDTDICGATVSYNAEAIGNPASTLTYTFSGATTGSGSGSGTGSLFNVGTTTVTLNSVNPCGNVTQSFNVTVTDNEAPEFLTTESHILFLDANGIANFDPNSFNSDTVKDNCDVASITFDKTSFNCDEVGFHTITATATDIHGNSSTGSVNIEVRDEILPTVITQNIIIDLDANGNATITPQMVDNGTFDNCLFTLSLNTTEFTCAQVGDNPVELIVHDKDGVIINSGSAIVTVRDVTPPTVITQNISIDLDANGSATINPSMIDNGSSDTCGIASMSLSQETFDCSNVGDNTVTLTVTDVNGNSASQTATVAVSDVTPPVVVAKNLRVELDANGSASITPQMVDDGTTDACGFTLALDTTSFDCSNIGDNTVTLTATDVNGNVASTTANIHIVDSVVPTVITQDLVVNLDDDGNASITKEQIDNGSNDACGIASTSIDISTFDCSNLGENTVTLTVTDVNGNVSTGTATVTVNDITPPTLGVQNISVTLDANGNASISPKDVIIKDENDIERGDQCEVSGTKHHAMYLNNYSSGYYYHYWKNGKKQEAPKGVKLNKEDAISTLDNSFKEKQPSQEESSRHSWWRKNARFNFDANGGTIVKNLDGTATVTGTLVNKRNPNDKWIVTLNLKNASTWNQWKDQGRRWKGSRRKVGQEYKNWTYYEMASGSKLTGVGNNAGKETNLYHAPYTRKYGFQLGNKANLKNANFGLSGWFYYKNKKGRWAQGDFNLNVTDCSQLPVPEGTVFTNDNCSITGYSLDIDSFGCDNLGENTVNVTVTDQSGNSTTKPITVTVLGEKPTVTIPDFRAVWGQKKNTVFLGYKETVHLCPVVSGGSGFTYEWTDENGNVFSTEKFPEVSPTVTSTYTVTVTNSNGCTDTASIEVCVIDARAKDRWGRYNGKVKVCHHSGHRHGNHCPSGSGHHSSHHGRRDRPISVSWYAVAAHLWYHGDTLGSCEAECITNDNMYRTEQTKVEETKSIEEDLLIYPNPSNGVFNIKLNATKTDAKILLFDVSGKLVDNKIVSKNNDSQNVLIGRNNLSSGIYLLRIISDNETVTKKLIVRKQ